MSSSEEETLRVKRKPKLVPAGASRKLVKSNAAPAAATKKKKNVYQNYANAIGREGLTAAEKKIVNSYPVLANAIGAESAKAKILETISKAYAKKSGAERLKAILAEFEKALERKLTKSEKERVHESVNSASKNEILAKFRMNPYKKLLGHSPSSAEVRNIQEYTRSEERKGANANTRKAMNKMFINGLKAKGHPPPPAAGEITEHMKKERTARLKAAKEASEAFDAKVAEMKVAAKADLMAARTKKGEPAAKGKGGKHK